MAKRLWQCTVCNDVHFGEAGPEVCPTCMNKDAYVEADEGSAKKLMGM